MTVHAARTPVRLPVWRARLVFAAFLALFVVLAVRSVYLQVLHTDFLRGKGEARYSRVLEVPATRGRIVDRNGAALAVSTPVKSVWAIPGDVVLSAAQRAKLALLLGMDARDLDRRLADQSRDFVYLKRQVSPEASERVAELGIAGVYDRREFRRYYPGGEVTAQVVGFTGVDENGQEGMELAFESLLAGQPGGRRVIKDRLGRVVEDIEALSPARDGGELALSIDGKIQSLAFSVLRSAVEQHRAKAGALIALDTHTGEVLALANYPSYNPNNRARMTGDQVRNRVLTDVFEPGSTLKPFTIALALELERVTPTTRIPTAPGSMTIARYTIRDSHPAAAMSVSEVVQRSSNVGAAKIALSLPRERMWEFFRSVGFGTPPQLDFPGEAGGRLRDHRSWRPVEQATMGYGHGISVSLAQLARAYLLFARDGDLVPLTLVRSATPAEGMPVISARTAHAMRAMLEAAVQPGGTAPRARVPGWRVAGKTGTAHKPEKGGYAANRYIASFVGFAPVSDPRLVIAVMIDEPSAGEYYGGSVAAPVFAQTMQGALRLLGVPYDAPLDPVPLPGEGEELREST
ncbi:MAG: penicillin-binding protein 2 [Betaproteobacteria bacterium]|nr:penicillin-binding protein 2 [Betaproteobacteria bacterium]